ncbi:MAG: hypothetical protein PT944_01425 [Actinomycetaceae bacterium]|nr:hypothetical protein [Arcanobacterium sp.]MDD7686565.1 hypothetical protein [Actinomycetaceae bacterium]MDY5272845.1 hypothetical protein [Arcanobacterium sp.]
MLKKTRQYSTSRVHTSVSVTASLTTIALATLITPQIILRAFVVGRANSVLFLTLAVGVVAFALTCLAVNGVTVLTPRRSTHQLATRYIGAWAGVLVGAAKILLHGLIVLLGVELVVTALNTIVRLGSWANPLAMTLVLALTIPTIAAGVGQALRWPRILAFIGILGLSLVLAWGLIQEFRGAVNFSDVLLAREDALKADPVSGRYFPYLESALGGCFPAAVIYAVSERVMALPSRRRVPTKRMLTVLIPMLVLIAVTLYFVVELQLPGRRLGLPALSITYALLGTAGRTVMAILFVLTGIAVAVASYRQLPRVLRELAIDGLLPRRLAAQDAVTPRRLIVVIVAALAAVISWFLDSTRSLAMIFIVITFFLGLTMCGAMVERSRSILNDSIDALERSVAKKALWAYRGYGLCLLAGLVCVVVIQPWWFGAAVLSLAVPVIFLVAHRKGLGKINEVLADDAGAIGRVIPTRVYSFVLIDHLDLPTLKALDWARANRGSPLQALCVDVDPERTRALRKEWIARKMPVALTVVGQPAGAVRGPVIEFIRAFRRMHPRDVVMVYMPKVISTGSWERFFVRHTTPSIISQLELEPGVMVTEVPYRIESARQMADDDESAGSDHEQRE